CSGLLLRPRAWEATFYSSEQWPVLQSVHALPERQVPVSLLRGPVCAYRPGLLPMVLWAYAFPVFLTPIELPHVQTCLRPPMQSEMFLVVPVLRTVLEPVQLPHVRGARDHLVYASGL